MRENLLVLAQTFATEKGWSLVTVSKKIHGNQRFLAAFTAGEVSTTLKTYDQMVGKLRAAWPPGLKWPKLRDVPAPVHRPAPPHARGRQREVLGEK